MIRFIFKGLMRDRNRSLIPFIVTATGVMLTVVFHAWITGVINNSIEFNARFASGHVKIMTRAYAENVAQVPNDLAILGTDTLMPAFASEFPGMDFASRIFFAGLIDVPDESGETRSQGPAMGIAIDLLSGNTDEIDRMNIASSLRSGTLPVKNNEAMLSNDFAGKLGLATGDTFTLVGTSMLGELTMHNFILCGTVEFGTTALDRGTLIADLSDVRQALNMEDASGEILGFFKEGTYDGEEAVAVTERFNARYLSEEDEFSMIMKSLSQQITWGSWWSTRENCRAYLWRCLLLPCH
ncbi:MAG: hypothetical protein U5L72_03765 [Bacteroidales bacterium]|nr:hypothetical protein [Bacteroidales bacterium]